MPLDKQPVGAQIQQHVSHPVCHPTLCQAQLTAKPANCVKSSGVMMPGFPHTAPSRTNLDDWQHNTLCLAQYAGDPLCCFAEIYAQPWHHRAACFQLQQATDGVQHRGSVFDVCRD